jgi:pimeloyl-ACP methyl ester carboxylesterase
MRFAMPSLDRSGVKIHYEVQGSGPVILLSHGYSATSRMWAGQVDALARDHKVVTWDMRGHGQSDYPDDQAAYTQSATVDDMAAILDAVGAKSAVVGGLSLGGYMSLAFTVKYPARVRALLIIDTGPGFKKDEAREGWNKTALETARAFEADGLARLKSRSAEMASATHRSAVGLIRAARGMLTQHDASVINALPDIRVPSLVIVGSEDKPFLAATDYMAAKIPGAKKVVIANAGHAANIDQPAAFNAAVLSFLGGLSA